MLTAGLGLKLTELTEGAVFSMVICAVSGVPTPSPSFGVTVQLTSSPPLKAPLRLAPAPTEVPATNHSAVEESESESASSKPA